MSPTAEHPIKISLIIIEMYKKQISRERIVVKNAIKGKKRIYKYLIVIVNTD